MSYVLHVWERPVPATLPEADRIQAALSEEHGAQNPKFLAFARELTQRYPCITTLPDESPDAVWSDGPLDGKSDRPVYAIGIQAQRLREALPVVRAAAARLGLTVYDMQAGCSYLSDGKVLGSEAPSGVADDGPAPGELDSTHEVLQLTRQQLQPLLESEGFTLRRSDNAFVRAFPDLTQDISIHAEDAYPLYRFKVFVTFWVTKGVDAVNAVFSAQVSDYVICSQSEKFQNFVAQRVDGYPQDGWFHVGTEAALAAAVDVQREYLRQVIFPCLRECNTIAGIHKWLNRIPVAENPLFGNSGPAFNVLIAHLAGDANRRELEQHLLDTVPDYEKPRLQQMISYLAAKAGPAT